MFGSFQTGIGALTLGHLIMIGIGFVLIYLSIAREIEPYELLPIGFGIIIANLPLTGIMALPTGEMGVGGLLGIIYNYGLYLYTILPPIVFLGLGAMADFGSLLGNPKTFLLGAAAQAGIFTSFLGALLLGFKIPEACSIGIIGGADGPTTIYTTALLAPDLMGINAVAAYSYMAMVALIQPPIIKALTTKEERRVVMKELRAVSRLEKIMFPLVALVFIVLIAPRAAPLIGMFMLGNLFKESGVVPRLFKASQNELMNIITIFLMVCIGASMSAEIILHPKTLFILGLGLAAFAIGTGVGVLFGKLMNNFSKEGINPMIGAAGVSAVPMAARVVQKLGSEADPKNNLLFHAFGPNLAGVVGSATVAGVFLGMVG